MQIASGFFCYISSGKQPNNPREVFETVKCFKTTVGNVFATANSPKASSLNKSIYSKALLSCSFGTGR